MWSQKVARCPTQQDIRQAAGKNCHLPDAWTHLVHLHGSQVHHEAQTACKEGGRRMVSKNHGALVSTFLKLQTRHRPHLMPALFTMACSPPAARALLVVAATSASTLAVFVTSHCTAVLPVRSVGRGDVLLGVGQKKPVKNCHLAHIHPPAHMHTHTIRARLPHLMHIMQPPPTYSPTHRWTRTTSSAPLSLLASSTLPPL